MQHPPSLQLSPQVPPTFWEGTQAPFLPSDLMVKQPRLLSDAPEAERWSVIVFINLDRSGDGAASIAGLLCSESEDVSYLRPSSERERGRGRAAGRERGRAERKEVRFAIQ